MENVIQSGVDGIISTLPDQRHLMILYSVLWMQAFLYRH